MTQPVHRIIHGEKALIALGSNVTSLHGSPQQTIVKAFAALDRAPLRVVAKSRVFLTPFVPAGGGADVTNAVVLVETTLSPAALLAHLHGIEAAFDRVRGARWTDRTLDLDLMAMGAHIMPDREMVARWMALPRDRQKRDAPDGLILPHPRLHERAFVLVPAADVAPEWRHPLTGQSIAEMRDGLPAAEVAAVSVLGEA